MLFVEIYFNYLFFLDSGVFPGTVLNFNLFFFSFDPFLLKSFENDNKPFLGVFSS
jgi:hypothetical protein